MAKTKKPVDAGIFFRLPSEVLSELEKLCIQQNKTKSEMLRQMVEKGMEREKEKVA